MPRHLNLSSIGMEIIDATLDREKMDEEELATSLKELEHLSIWKNITRTPHML
jgi:hypothetical protein